MLHVYEKLFYNISIYKKDLKKIFENESAIIIHMVTLNSL